MKILLLLISFNWFLAAQAQNETLIPANPPTGVGGACSATTYGYMQALTGGDRVVVCDPVTHLWTVLGSGGGGGGSIGGTIASGQVAFGTAPDTVGGSANFIFAVTPNAPSDPALTGFANPDFTSAYFVSNLALKTTYERAGQVVIANNAADSNGWFGDAAVLYVTGRPLDQANGSLYGAIDAHVTTSGSETNNLDQLIAIYGKAGLDVNAGKTINDAIALYGSVGNGGGGGTIVRTTGIYLLVDGSGGPSTNGFGTYVAAMPGFTNAYSFWADEQGVFRIKADNTFNSVYQAIPALYNPQVTKYTPGAANYERIVLGQWNSNVAEIGTEKGGTGTLRQVQMIGNGWIAVSYAFASLGALTSGTFKYCSDCTVTSGTDNTCTASGSGAWAERINGAWKCTL